VKRIGQGKPTDLGNRKGARRPRIWPDDPPILEGSEIEVELTSGEHLEGDRGPGQIPCLSDDSMRLK
jgi:hypothetical protein